MSQLQTATLDANDETMTINVGGTERAFITMDIGPTITVTWTVSNLNGTTFIPLRKADDAIEVLTDGLTVIEVTDKIVHLYKERCTEQCFGV